MEAQTTETLARVAGKLQERRPRGKCNRKWQGNVEMDIKENSKAVMAELFIALYQEGTTI